MDKTVLIGASDAPLSNAQMQKAPGPVLRLPTVLGAVSIVYAKQQDRAKDDALENLLHRMRHEEQSTPQTKRFKSAKSSFAANKACHWLSGPPPLAPPNDGADTPDVCAVSFSPGDRARSGSATRWYAHKLNNLVMFRRLADH